MVVVIIVVVVVVAAASTAVLRAEVVVVDTSSTVMTGIKTRKIARCQQSTPRKYQGIAGFGTIGRDAAGQGPIHKELFESWHLGCWIKMPSLSLVEKEPSLDA